MEGADDCARDEGQGNEGDTLRAQPAMGREVTPDENNEAETCEEDIGSDDRRPHG